MAITAECACGKTISARDELAGRRVKCPSCQDAITLPARSGNPAGATIAIRCGCGKSFRAQPEWVGKTVKCPGCAQPVTIPGASVSASEANHLSPQPVSDAGIDIRCPCGKAIKAPLRLAGKNVRCPTCGSPLAIPKSLTGNGGPSVSGHEDEAGDDFRTGIELAGDGHLNSLHDQGIDNDISGLVGLLDELGLEASKTGLRCPNCRSDIAPEAVLCTNCGYHLETGKQLKRSSFVKGNVEDAKIGPPKKKNERKGVLRLWGQK